MTQESPTESNSVSQFLLFGIHLLFFVTANLFTASLLLVVGIPALEFSLPIAALLTAAFSWYSLSRYATNFRFQLWLIHLAACAAVIVITTVLASLWFDTTIDGQTYHSEAVLSLGQGWNPYRSDAPVDAVYPEWTGFFSKAAWVNAATIFRLTGNVEAGKAFQGILLIASFAIARGTFTAQPRTAVLFSLLLALNPVSVYQLFSFYVDGQLASCLTIFVCLLLLLERSYSNFLLFALCMTALLIVNLKLNGAIYLAVFAGGFVLWLAFKRRVDGWRVLIALGVTGIIAVLFVGYNPFISQYVQELLTRGDPFYPTQWQTLIRIEPNTPFDLLAENRFTRLAISLFSQSQVGTEHGAFKLPFLLYPSEMFNFRYPDTRLGGFGPFFSGACLLAIGIALVGVWRNRRAVNKITFPVFLLLLIALSVISSDQGWWARYAPQLWMVPVLIAALVLPTASTWLKRFTLALLLTLFVNVALVTTVYIALGVLDQNAVRQDLARLQVQSETAPIEINFNAMPMTQWRFDQMGIAYHITSEDLPVCTEGQTLRNLLYSLSIICGTG